MKKTLLWILIALIAFSLLLFGLIKSGVMGKNKGTKVAVEKVALHDIIETVSASGKIYPVAEVKISRMFRAKLRSCLSKKGIV